MVSDPTNYMLKCASIGEVRGGGGGRAGVLLSVNVPGMVWCAFIGDTPKGWL